MSVPSQDGAGSMNAYAPAMKRKVVAKPKKKVKKKKNFINTAIKKPGALHQEMGVPPGQKIPPGKMAAAANAPGKLGQRARFAELLSRLRKG